MLKKPKIDPCLRIPSAVFLGRGPCQRTLGCGFAVFCCESLEQPPFGPAGLDADVDVGALPRSEVRYPGEEREAAKGKTTRSTHAALGSRSVDLPASMLEWSLRLRKLLYDGCRACVSRLSGAPPCLPEDPHRSGEDTAAWVVTSLPGEHTSPCAGRCLK